MGAQYIKIRLKNYPTLYLALTAWIGSSRLTIVGVATDGSLDGDDYGWYVDDTVLNNYSGTSSLLTDSEEHTSLGRYVIGRNASVSNRAELFSSSSSSFSSDPAQYQFDFEYFFETGILKLVNTSFALTAASTSNKSAALFMDPDESNQNQLWEIVDQYGNVIEKPQEISSWQDPVRITTISSGVSSSGTASINCYEAGYVRYKTPSYAGKLVCKTTTHNTSPDYYSHLSTTTLVANDGIERSSAVTGDILISDDDGMSDGSFDTKIEWEHTNNTQTYYYWYVNGPWAATGTYQIPWQLNYYRQYTITFNANGGINAPSALVFYEDNLLVTMPTSIPERNNYSFLGWSSNAAASTPEYFAGSQYTITNNNVTLYAVWEEAKKILTYDANGGNGGPDSEEVDVGVDHIVNVQEALWPNRDGYIFKGWGHNSTDKTPAFPIGQSKTYSITQDTTIYAVWWPEFKWETKYSRTEYNDFLKEYIEAYIGQTLANIAENTIYQAQDYNSIANVLNVTTVTAGDKIIEEHFIALQDAYNNYDNF